MQYPVKWFENSMPGRPEWDESDPKSLINVFRQCLVYGFGDVDVASATNNGSDEVTLTLGSHSGEFQKHQIVEVVNAKNSEWDSEYRVKEVNGNDLVLKVEFTMPTSDLVDTSTKVKTAPVGGWELQFHNGSTDGVGATKAVFRSTDADATGCIFYIDSDDTSIYQDGRRIKAYAAEKANSLTDHVNTYNGDWAWINAGPKNSGAVPYLLIADSKFVYVRTPGGGWTSESNYSEPEGGTVCAFGDFVSYKPGDRWNHIHMGTNTHENWRASWSNFGRLNNSNHWKIARDVIQINSGIDAGTFSSRLINYYSRDGIPYPNYSNRSLILERVYINEKGSHSNIRGELPGIWAPLHDELHNTFDFDSSSSRRRYILEGINSDPEAIIMLVTVGAYFEAREPNEVAFPAFDIKGPWR